MIKIIINKELQQQLLEKGYVQVGDKTLIYDKETNIFMLTQPIFENWKLKFVEEE